MAIFLALLLAWVAVYAIVASTLPVSESEDSGFDDSSHRLDPMRLLSDPAVADPYEAYLFSDPVPADSATASWLQVKLWSGTALLLYVVWWSNRQAAPIAPNVTVLAQKIAPATAGLGQYAIPFVPSKLALKKAETDSLTGVDTLSEANLERDTLQGHAPVGLTPHKTPVFMLKLAEYSQPEGVALLGTLFPGENIQCLPMEPGVYWAGVFFDTYGAAKRAFLRWEQNTPRWERHGLTLELIHLRPERGIYSALN